MLSESPPSLIIWFFTVKDKMYVLLPILEETQLDMVLRVQLFSWKFLSPAAGAFVLALKIRKDDLGRGLFYFDEPADSSNQYISSKWSFKNWNRALKRINRSSLLEIGHSMNYRMRTFIFNRKQIFMQDGQKLWWSIVKCQLAIIQNYLRRELWWSIV